MKKFLLLTLSVSFVFAACEKDNDTPEPSPVNPSDTTSVSTDTTQINKDTAQITETSVNAYGFLKSYIDRTRYPNFKLTAAHDVKEFHSNKNGVYDTITAHFDEIVAGNAMKYASVVGGSGKMNFTTVKQFVEDAKASNMTIYGHTLAWHSQQQPGYLLGLIADREVDVPDSAKVDIEDVNLNYKGMKSWNYWKASLQDEENNVDYSINTTADGVLITNKLVAKDNYRVQYQIANNLTTKVGTEYTMTIKIKASAAATVSFSVGSWYPDNYGDTLSVTEEMTEYTINFEPKVDGGFVLLQTGSFVGDILIESLKITHKGSDQTIPLTDEEKRDTLTWAMDNWIAGMMEATDGYVKAWDVVNEAISGGDRDGDGIYDLQNYENNNIDDPTNVPSGVFYWQAFMGDLEYVRTAVASARKHFKGDPSDLKLFINDYNLESNWDGNGKLKSLVKWIEKWESDGVTKIDGIGTQMHISCYESASVQKSVENAIVNMFKIMAATGKLCRISELDMSYVRGSSQWGDPLKTEELTETEHQKMADFYEFVIKKYFELIPVEQQYGICQWCLTDAKSSSSWRAGQPVGIWTSDFKNRKAAYGGFVRGLKGANE